MTETPLKGVKHDHGKTNWSSMPWEALDQVAQVMTYGASKYGTNNWRGGFKYSRVISAAFRHFTAWVRGENTDEETGLSHLAHACCCLLFLLTFEQTKTGVDDRFKYGGAA